MEKLKNQKEIMEPQSISDITDESIEKRFSVEMSEWVDSNQQIKEHYIELDRLKNRRDISKK